MVNLPTWSITPGTSSMLMSLLLSSKAPNSNSAVGLSIGVSTLVDTSKTSSLLPQEAVGNCVVLVLFAMLILF